MHERGEVHRRAELYLGLGLGLGLALTLTLTLTLALALALALTLTITWQAEQAVPVDVGQLPQLPSARGVGRA